MNKLIYIFSLMISSLACCQINKMAAIACKNECYSNTLSELRNTSIYKQVFTQFRDTFEILKSQMKAFGVPGYAENRIDDAIFFKSDSSDCILIVMQRPYDTSNVFATTRVISGRKFNNNWFFLIGLEFMHDKDYFRYYKKNNFENISKLSRYAILTSGNPAMTGCKIDEDFWFNQMKY